MKAEQFCNRLLAEDFSLCRFHNLNARGEGVWMDRGPESTVTARFRRRCVCERMASIWTVAEFSFFFQMSLNCSSVFLHRSVNRFVCLVHVGS